jgi:hypothetical protein
MRGKLDERFQKSPTFNAQAPRSFKPGHMRQNSGSSTATTQSTWSKSSHSRQSSGSSMVSFAHDSDGARASAPKMPARMISLSQAVPEYGNVTEPSISGLDQWTTGVPDQWTAAMPGQWMTPAQWPASGMVQYALVAVAVPQQPAIDPSVPYVCLPQELAPHSQLESQVVAAPGSLQPHVGQSMPYASCAQETASAPMQSEIRAWSNPWPRQARNE